MDTATGWTRELLYQLVDNVREYAIFAADPKGVTVSWNDGAEAIFGYTPEEVIGKPGEILFTPDDRASRIPEIEMKTSRETGRAADERWHVRKDGSCFFASGVMTALRDEGGGIIGYMKICRDLTDRVRLQDELDELLGTFEARVDARIEDLAASNRKLQVEVTDRKHSEERRTAMLRRIIRSQEDERKRVARDIHDHIGQQMIVLKLKLSTLALAQSNAAELHSRVADIQEVANRIDSDVDFLAWELRPTVLDDLGLAPAIRKYVDDWSEHFRIAAEFQLVDWNGTMLAPEIEINLYRIAQEALNNVCKHAGAENASVILEEREGLVRLIVEDDGVGFDAEQKMEITESGSGLGLIGMQERAELLGGNIEIETAPGRGTTVFARIPARRESG